MQKRVNQLKRTKPPPRRQLLIHKKSKNAKKKDKKSAKTQKEQKIALARQLLVLRTCLPENHFLECEFLKSVSSLRRRDENDVEKMVVDLVEQLHQNPTDLELLQHHKSQTCGRVDPRLGSGGFGLFWFKAAGTTVTLQDPTGDLSCTLQEHSEKLGLYRGGGNW